MKDIGEEIRRLRKIKGISQEELAERVGVSRQTIYKWESNYVSPSADNIKILCDIFEVSNHYFYVDDLALCEEPAPKKSKKNYLKIFSIVNGCFVGILSASTLVTGLRMISTISGDVVKHTFDNYDMFYILLILSCIFFALEIVLIILFKYNANKK